MEMWLNVHPIVSKNSQIFEIKTQKFGLFFPKYKFSHHRVENKISVEHDTYS